MVFTALKQMHVPDLMIVASVAGAAAAAVHTIFAVSVVIASINLIKTVAACVASLRPLSCSALRQAEPTRASISIRRGIFLQKLEKLSAERSTAAMSFVVARISVHASSCIEEAAMISLRPHGTLAHCPVWGSMRHYHKYAS